MTCEVMPLVCGRLVKADGVVVCATCAALNLDAPFLYLTVWIPNASKQKTPPLHCPYRYLFDELCFFLGHTAKCSPYL